MTKAKSKGGRGGKGQSSGAQKEAEANEGRGEVAPSPAAEARMNIRMQGGVDERSDQVGPERVRTQGAYDMVSVPRLDHTIIYGGRKYYPSETETEIPFGAAVTFGLTVIEKGRSSGRITGQSLVTDEDRPKYESEDDNGTGGDGRARGDSTPADSVADQAPVLDEINEAAEANNRSQEQALASREQERESIRASITPNVR